MARRHLVSSIACAAVAWLAATGGTALGAPEERGSAWGAARAERAGSGQHWSVKPAEAPPAVTPEKTRTSAKADTKPAPAEPAANETQMPQATSAPVPRGWGAPTQPKTEAAAGSRWGVQKTAEEPPAAQARPAAAAVTIAARQPQPSRAHAKRHKGPAVQLAWSDAAGKRRRPGVVTVEWPESLVPRPVAPEPRVPHASAPRHIELLWEATPVMEPPAPKPQAALAGTPKAAAHAELSKPAPTGLERLSNEWPAWVKVAIQYRGRTEYAEPLAAKSIGQDGYYLNRVRLQATVVPTSWLQFVVQTQDSQALGYGATPVSRFTNTVDMRLGYAEVTVPGAQPITLRGGRQELALGDGRLVGTSDWGNTNRAYDGMRVSTRTPVGKLDVFAISPVVVTMGAFDKWKQGEWMYGAYTTVEKVIPRTVLEPYAFVRTQQDVPSEAKVLGDARLVTVGSRAVLKLRTTLDANLDAAVQRGDVAGDTVAAWAAHAGIAWMPAHVAFKPKLSGEYNFASGDDSPADGRRGTFDQLYASNHSRYGLVDAVGWRNVHHVGATVEAMPLRKLKAGSGVHYLALATVTDGLYSTSGTRVILNRKATSRSIGWETDGWVSYAISKELSLAAGVGVLFAGEYLQQSSTFDRVWSPYLTWNVKF